MPQILDIIANENAHYKDIELESFVHFDLCQGSWKGIHWFHHICLCTKSFDPQWKLYFIHMLPLYSKGYMYRHKFYLGVEVYIETHIDERDLFFMVDWLFETPYKWATCLELSTNVHVYSLDLWCYFQCPEITLWSAVFTKNFLMHRPFGLPQWWFSQAQLNFYRPNWQILFSISNQSKSEWPLPKPITLFFSGKCSHWIRIL